MNIQYKIAALGTADSVFPFRQMGVDVFEPDIGTGLMMQVAELVKAGYGVFFVSEDCLRDTPMLLTAYDRDPAVTVVPIPGLAAEGGLGKERLQSMVEKALGQNIL